MRINDSKRLFFRDMYNQPFNMLQTKFDEFSYRTNGLSYSHSCTELRLLFDKFQETKNQEAHVTDRLRRKIQPPETFSPGEYNLPKRSSRSSSGRAEKASKGRKPSQTEPVQSSSQQSMGTEPSLRTIQESPSRAQSRPRSPSPT